MKPFCLYFTVSNISLLIIIQQYILNMKNEEELIYIVVQHLCKSLSMKLSYFSSLTFLSLNPMRTLISLPEMKNDLRRKRGISLY